ncbi:CBS-domain-containing protein [Vararia minispora EC-137]|uniref:CBS-domain-containing protein n=1 Tax=Vararia minispora EC-137 TaxID=1314806 RepID=A0ACB8QGA1_9AGAM|nr:CBS-domain-containing protein [Vararia minispora EC-137]
MNGPHASLSPSQQSPKVRKRPSTRRPRAGSHLPPVQSQESHDAALASIRNFLKSRTSYDAFPVSFRLLVLDSKLEVKRALQCLLHNGVVSAPLWNSEKSMFAGMFTVSDIIHLIQYYYHNSSYDNAAADVETFRLESLRGNPLHPDIEKSLGVATPPLIREHPDASLYIAAKRLIQTHARRLPLLDKDTGTGHEVIVSVLTQYRLLKFISINCTKEIQLLHLPLRKLGIGTYVEPPLPVDERPEDYSPYHPIATATMSTTVFDVVHMFSERGISAVPIVDEEGIVVNLYETVDVITLVRLGAYQALDLTISEALNQRSPDFPGVVICTASDSIGTLLQLIKKRRVHRLVVVEGDGRLLGIITLSDVLRYVTGETTVGSKASTREPSEMTKPSGSSTPLTCEPAAPATPSDAVPPAEPDLIEDPAAESAESEQVDPPPPEEPPKPSAEDEGGAEPEPDPEVTPES